MTSGPVVSNLSPLISLERIGQQDLLRAIFAQLQVPPAVQAEVFGSNDLPDWVVVRRPAQSIGPQILRASLGAGESEAISLALELHARRVILDDRPARRLAQALGLPVVGTLGILLAGKRRGLLPAVGPMLDGLKAAGFHVAPPLHEQVLRDAGEGP